MAKFNQSDINLVIESIKAFAALNPGATYCFKARIDGETFGIYYTRTGENGEPVEKLTGALRGTAPKKK